MSPRAGERTAVRVESASRTTRSASTVHADVAEKSSATGPVLPSDCYPGIDRESEGGMRATFVIAPEGVALGNLIPALANFRPWALRVR
jgi:hypothetical protein